MAATARTRERTAARISEPLSVHARSNTADLLDHPLSGLGRPKRLYELVEEEKVRDRQLVRVRGGACLHRRAPDSVRLHGRTGVSRTKVNIDV